MWEYILWAISLGVAYYLGRKDTIKELRDNKVHEERGKPVIRSITHGSQEL